MANRDKALGNTGPRIRTRHRFLGVQPSDVDELEPGGDETDEDRGIMKRQRRARGGHAGGEHSKARADKPRRGRLADGGRSKLQTGGMGVPNMGMPGLPAGGAAPSMAGVPMGGAMPAGGFQGGAPMAAQPGGLTPAQQQAVMQQRAAAMQRLAAGAAPSMAGVPVGGAPPSGGFQGGAPMAANPGAALTSAQQQAMMRPPGMARGGRAEKWIQGTGVDKPGHKGRLHRALHVPEGEPIPAGKLAKALHSSDPHMQHMAQFAKNVKR